MADLNDDIKKYLRGEMSPAEMHALEKQALNDPFLEDALEGAVQLDAEAFDADLKNLRASLDERVSKKAPKTISLWVWPARIAAGLILVALSTFVIVKLTGDKKENDLALKRESSSPAKDNANENVASDSLLSRNANADSKQAAKPSPAPSERRRDAETEESKPAAGAAGPTAVTANADEISQGDKAKDGEPLADATEAVAEEQPVQNASAEADKELALKKQSEGIKLDEDDQKQRVATATPESRAKGLGKVTISKVIRGRVESVDGVALPGVNVMIKNTNIGTVTDGSGNYQLSVPENKPGLVNNPSLVFSFIGFSSTEVDAGDKTQLDVRLDEDVSQLSEVVVVGYGSEKKGEDDPEPLELANPYGGRRAFKQYLEKNLQYPEQALAENIEGKVTVQFTVESSGQLSDFKVLKGIGHGCEEEVIRLVKQGPKWNPTRRNTESLRDKVKVRMKFTLPKK